MDALIVYPENKEQLAAIKAVMKAMKVKFQQQAEFPEHVVKGVKESLKMVEAGEFKPYTDIRSMLKNK